METQENVTADGRGVLTLLSALSHLSCHVIVTLVTEETEPGVQVTECPVSHPVTLTRSVSNPGFIAR